MRRARVAVAAGVLSTCVFVLAGCGVVPAAPGDGASAPSSAVHRPATTGSGTDPGGSRSTTAATRPGGFTRLEQAALRVRRVGCGGVATGSGFAIGPHAFVTNRHVVRDMIEMEAEAYDGRDIGISTARAAVVADLAIIRTVDRLPVHLTLASRRAAIGDRVTVVGYPLGGPLTTARGTVIGYERDPLGESWTQALVSDAPIEHGSSGSAIVDRAGHVVGVAYAGMPHTSVAVPVDVLQEVLADPASTAVQATCDPSAPPVWP